eukprot:8541610-Karenia_brevis.AAC.1
MDCRLQVAEEDHSDPSAEAPQLSPEEAAQRQRAHERRLANRAVVAAIEVETQTITVRACESCPPIHIQQQQQQ